MTDAALGISLGSASCYVAVANIPKGGARVEADLENIRAEVVANDAGDRSTPMAVAVVSGEVVWGMPAARSAVRFPKKTVKAILRLLTKDAAEAQRIGGSADVIISDEGEVTLPGLDDENEKVYTGREIIQLFLERLREVVCESAAPGCERVVFALPAGTDVQAFYDVAVAAGFPKSTRVVSQASAVVLERGMLHKKASAPAHAVVLDWGATGLTGTLVSIAAGTKQVLAEKTLRDGCGGWDLDNILVNLAKTEFQRKTRMDPSDDGRAMRKLRAAADAAKVALSSSSTSTINVEAFFEGCDLSSTLTRMRFDMGLRDQKITQKPAELLKELLKDHADVPVDFAVFVGGCAKIPLLMQALGDAVRKELPNAKIVDIPERVMDESAAVGASLQAAMATLEIRPTSYAHSVATLPQDISIAMGEGAEDVVLFHAGHAVPVTQRIELGSDAPGANKSVPRTLLIKAGGANLACVKVAEECVALLAKVHANGDLEVLQHTGKGIVVKPDGRLFVAAKE